jgi:acetyl esterase/lipase
MPCNESEFAPPRIRERLTAAILRAVLRTLVKPVLSPNVPIVRQRWWLEQLARLIGASRQTQLEAGVAGGVKGEWMRPLRSGDAAPADTPTTILYLHGGGYCVGSPQTHRVVTSRLARATGLPVFVADYRLAPEHPFPCALDDAVSACRSLMQAGPVVIAGDSAGGGLALATALYLCRHQIGSAAALVLFSPWADLTLSAITDEAREEVMLSAAWLADCARHYLAGESDSNPLASPIFAELGGLPPTFIQAGADELLRSDAVRVSDALVAARVTTQCEIVPGQWHTFQLHAELLPAANAAIERAADFISLALALALER